MCCCIGWDRLLIVVEVCLLVDGVVERKEGKQAENVSSVTCLTDSSLLHHRASF